MKIDLFQLIWSYSMEKAFSSVPPLLVCFSTVGICVYISVGMLCLPPPIKQPGFNQGSSFPDLISPLPKVPTSKHNGWLKSLSS